MNKYTQASINLRESEQKKIRMNNKMIGDHGITFQKLTQIIPNWETYLTDVQLESAKLYLQHMDCVSVDNNLGLRVGTSQNRLFDMYDKKGYRCALRRLEDVFKRLKEEGYYDRLKKQQELLKNKGARTNV